MSDGRQTPSAASISSTSLSSLATPVSESYEGLSASFKASWRFKSSPALSLEDMLSNGSISPIVDDGQVRQIVRQAQDACIWLKSAGFPQYVHKFEAGEFPINVTKLQVEKDHLFLDSASLEALIKRLNILNRCAGLLEDVMSKNEESDDEDTMRALSEQWQFQKSEQRWSRKNKKKISLSSISSPARDTTLFEDGASEALMVSELSSSPTHFGGSLVKTYTFCADKKCSVSSLPSPSVIINHSTNENDEKHDHKCSDLLPVEDEEVHELERMGSFAAGMLSEFDANLLQLRRGSEYISRSLPNVYTSSVSPTELQTNGLDPSHTGLSSLTGSTSSIGDLDKDELIMDNDSMSQSPPIHSRGASGGDTCPIDNTWEASPGSSPFGEISSPACGYHQQIGRRNTMESNDSTFFLEQMDILSDSQRQSPQSFRAKWHSFQRQHSFRHLFKPLRTLIPIEELSVGQIMVLRKLSLVKLTALIELHNGKTNVSRILKSRRRKYNITRSKKIFGSPLSNNVLHFGQALPPVILQAMDHLKRTGMETIGLFRRTAAKARVEALRDLIETAPDLVNFSDYTSYEIADVLKLYFRELPEPLLTSKLSEALLVCYECIPEQVRLQAQQSIVLLLNDENREALQCLLDFLAFVASHSNTHQMDEQNLGLCLSPTLFSLSSVVRPSLSRRGSLKRPYALSPSNSPHLLTVANNKELNEHIVSSRCLAELIRSHDNLFKIAADMMQLCKFSHLEFGDPVPFQELGCDVTGSGGYQTYINDCMATLAKEQRRRYRGWIHCDPLKGVGLAYCKVDDGIPLRLWRGTVEIPSSPDVVLHRLWEERFLWDGHVIRGRRVAQLDPKTEVFQYVTPSMTPLASRDHCILRSWQFDAVNEAYIVIATSVSHPNATLLAGVRCTELAMRYLIEPAENGTTHLSFFCRVDIRGKSADFYNQYYGRYLASSIHKLRDSFKRSLELEYLETPV